MMYIGLDLGTSGLKGILIDADQRVVAEASAPLTVQRPHSGWSEQAPSDWIAAAEAVFSVLSTHGLDAVRGIGLSGQMHGATLLDRADDVLRPCILWNDTRSYAEAAAMDANPVFRRISGNIVFPGFTAPKLAWVKAHERHLFRPGGQGVAAQGLPAAVADRRACVGNVGCGGHELARYRRAGLVR